VDPSALDAYVGVYQLAPTFSVTITREANRLYAQATGQPRLQLYAESPNEFFFKEVDAQITFEKDASGKVNRMILHQNGMNIPGPKQ
jgi:uncharacterized protein YneR